MTTKIMTQPIPTSPHKPQSFLRLHPAAAAQAGGGAAGAKLHDLADER